jgi:hypothetical protein
MAGENFERWLAYYIVTQRPVSTQIQEASPMADAICERWIVPKPGLIWI